MFIEELKYMACHKKATHPYYGSNDQNVLTLEINDIKHTC